MPLKGIIFSQTYLHPSFTYASVQRLTARRVTWGKQMKRHYILMIIISVVLLLGCTTTLGGCGLPNGELDQEGCISLYDQYIDQCKHDPSYLLSDGDINQSQGFCGPYDPCIGQDGYLTKCIEDNQHNCQAVYDCIEDR
jgi:hypothetical protein